MKEHDKFDESLDALLREQPSFPDSEAFTQRVVKQVHFQNLTRLVILVAGWSAGLVLCYLAIPDVSRVVQVVQDWLFDSVGQSIFVVLLAATVTILLLMGAAMLPVVLFGRRGLLR